MNGRRSLLLATVVVVLLIGAVFVLPAAANPIEITSAEELTWITGSNLSQSYLLKTDITINNASWAGIGTDDAPFTGNFDGGGHTVSLEGATNHGLFNRTDDAATINNTVMSVTTQIGGFDVVYAGALIHRVIGATKIDDCSVVLSASGSVTGNSAGGLVGGILGASSSITNCSVVGGNVAGYYAGGLVGYVDCYSSTSVVITNCSVVDVDVTGGEYAGGLVGGILGASSSITNCSVVGGNVTGDTAGGLFGYAYGGAMTFSITNCSVSGVDVTGKYVASGLVSTILGGSGSLANCSVTGGNVTSSEFAGGLVGYFENAANIENCFAATNVSGIGNVGGLIGYDEGTGTITHCYAAGTVTSTGADTGGIAGNSSNTAISHTFALNQKVSGTTNVNRITGRSGTPLSNNYAWSEMTGAAFTLRGADTVNGADISSGSIWNNKTTFETEGFDFTTNWTLGTGSTYQLPVLKHQAVPVFDARYLAPPFAGSGTENDPYLVTTEEGLKRLPAYGGQDVYFKLANEIPITDAGWAGLGTPAAPFSGHLDGAGHTITFATAAPKAGLFNATKDAEITNIPLVITTIIDGTGSNIGGLIGTADNTTVNNCTVTLTLPGGITGADGVGGLIGTANAGVVITDCDVLGTGSVTATGMCIGGLVGMAYPDSIITTSSSSVAVTGTGGFASGVGGLVGGSMGTITNSYATGSVTATGASASGVGGLVGIIDGATVETSYAAGDVTSIQYVGGLIGGFDDEGNQLTNSVALNARVSGDADTNRTVGVFDASYGTLTNNFANAGMLDKNGSVFANGTGSDLAGADVSAASAGTLSWWTSAAPTGPGFSSDIWGMQDGKLVFKRQIPVGPPTPTPTPTPTTPGGSSSGDGNDGGVSSVVVGDDGTADLRAGTGITKVSFPKGTTGVLTVDRAVSVTTPAPAGTKGVFGTYGVTFPTFEGYADLHFSVPSAILADQNLGVHDVALYRLEGTTWQKVTTYYLGESRGAAEYSALVRTSGTYAIMYEANGAQVVLKATSEPTTGATASGTTKPAAGSAKSASGTTTHQATPSPVKTTAPSGVSPTMTQASTPLLGMLAGLMAGACVILTRGRRE